MVTTIGTIPRRYLKHTQEFGVRSPFHERLEFRCLHRDDIAHVSDEDYQINLDANYADDDTRDDSDPVDEHLGGASDKVSVMACSQIYTTECKLYKY